MNKHEIQGLWLGLLGVVMFSMTLPVTRLAVGSSEAPFMTGYFIAFGRAAVAGLLSVAYLFWVKAAPPNFKQCQSLAMVSIGVVFGFPLLTSLAMRYVPAAHASVITGVLPLATAALAARVNRQRPSLGFWLCAFGGCGLVLGFAILRSGQSGWWPQTADLMLLAAMALGAIGYVWGGRLSKEMPAQQVISWALLMSLPMTLPLAWLSNFTVSESRVNENGGSVLASTDGGARVRTAARSEPAFGSLMPMQKKASPRQMRGR